jgi:16S rRNA (uracil1498-N3)-methyltransferase
MAHAAAAMSLPRFHIPPEQWTAASLALSGDEARHCTQVMRRGVGDHIVAFNGAGEWAECRIETASKNHVDLSRVSGGLTPAPSVSITLLQAIPKAGNMELIIEKSVELGANAILPVLSERTVVKLDEKEAARKREKWQRIALEACKQCGQNWLPTIHTPRPYGDVWSTLPGHDDRLAAPDLRLIAAIMPGARALHEILSSHPLSLGNDLKSVLIAIGPEGDFTAAEYQTAFDHGCHPLSLGPIILRVETAALYCLSILNHSLRIGS